MIKFWNAKRVKLAVKFLKNSHSLQEVVEKMEKVYKRPISISTLQKSLVTFGYQPRDILLPRIINTRWTKANILELRKMFEKSVNLQEALLRAKRKFGNDVSVDTIRSAFLRNGLSSALNEYVGKKTTPVLKAYTQWTDDKIQQAIGILKKHRNIPEAVIEMNNKMGFHVSQSRLNTVIKGKYGIGTTPCAFLAGSAAPPIEDDVLKLVKYIKKHEKKHISLRGLCDEFDCSPKKMEFLISNAKACGYDINAGSDTLSLNTDIPIEKITQDVFIPSATKRQFRIGVIADTHFGSQGALVKELQHFVNLAYDEFGVRTMLHCGDILAGDHVFKGQIAELDHWGCQKQCTEAAKNLPKLDGLTYWGILGNHDISFVKNSGIDVGKVLESMRPDIHVIGTLKQKIRLNGVEIELAHLKSAAHARSYSLEKHIYRTISRSNQPQAVFCGHRHTNGYFEVQRIHTFLVPCFEDLSMFLLYHDFLPSIGGVIVDFFLDKDNNIIRVTPQFHLYHIENTPDVNVSV